MRNNFSQMQMSNKNIARYIFGIFGLFIMSFGIAVMVSLSEGSFSLGQYPFETLGLTVLEVLHRYNINILTLGLWSIILNGTFFVLLVVLRKRHHTLHWTVIKGLIPVFLFSIPMGWFLELIQDYMSATIVPNAALRITIYIIAVLVANLGNAMFQVANIANFPLNDWNEEYAFFAKKSFGFIRVIIDSSSLLLSVILTIAMSNDSFYIGFATPFLMLLTGPLLEFYLRFLRKNIRFIDTKHNVE